MCPSEQSTLTDLVGKTNDLVGLNDCLLTSMLQLYASKHTLQPQNVTVKDITPACTTSQAVRGAELVGLPESRLFLLHSGL